MKKSIASSWFKVSIFFVAFAIELGKNAIYFNYSCFELSDFEYKDNHIIWNITKLAEDSLIFCRILTVESDLQTQFAANRSNHTALTASIRLSFLFGWWAEAKFLRTIPIGELVCTAVETSKRSIRMLQTTFNHVFKCDICSFLAKIELKSQNICFSLVPYWMDVPALGFAALPSKDRSSLPSWMGIAPKLCNR